MKHAGADNVDIDLATAGNRVTFEITDDGCGFDRIQARRDGENRFGLFSIEERLRQFGGGLELDTTPGRGTRIRLHAGINGDAS